MKLTKKQMIDLISACPMTDVNALKNALLAILDNIIPPDPPSDTADNTEETTNDS